MPKVKVKPKFDHTQYHDVCGLEYGRGCRCFDPCRYCQLPRQDHVLIPLAAPLCEILICPTSIFIERGFYG